MGHCVVIDPVRVVVEGKMGASSPPLLLPTQLAAACRAPFPQRQSVPQHPRGEELQLLFARQQADIWV